MSWAAGRSHGVGCNGWFTRFTVHALFRSGESRGRQKSWLLAGLGVGPVAMVDRTVVVEAGGFASPVWFTVHALFLNIFKKIEKQEKRNHHPCHDLGTSVGAGISSAEATPPIDRFSGPEKCVNREPREPPTLHHPCRDLGTSVGARLGINHHVRSSASPDLKSA